MLKMQIIQVMTTMSLFATVSLHKTQLSFTLMQLRLRVERIDYSIWLGEQLQLHENKILVKIISIVLEIMF
jgi:hypothetical protein